MFFFYINDLKLSFSFKQVHSSNNIIIFHTKILSNHQHFKTGQKKTKNNAASNFLRIKNLFLTIISFLLFSYFITIIADDIKSYLKKIKKPHKPQKTCNYKDISNSKIFTNTLHKCYYQVYLKLFLYQFPLFIQKAIKCLIQLCLTIFFIPVKD